MSREQPNTEEFVDANVDEEVTEPPMYNVLIHNDDYTTKEFVVELLVTVFQKSRETATQLMFSVHNNGVGVAGTYPRDVAETKVTISTSAAREHGFPLQLTLEED